MLGRSVASGTSHGHVHVYPFCENDPAGPPRITSTHLKYAADANEINQPVCYLLL